MNFAVERRASKKSYRLRLAIVFAFAVALRLLVLAHDQPIHLGGDEPEYVGLATKLAETGNYVSSDYIQRQFQGGNPNEPTAFRSPIFPAFLALHFKLFGDDLLFPRVTLVLIAGAVCFLIAFLADLNGFSPNAGLLAAFVWAIYPPSVFGSYSSDRILSEGIGVFLIVSAFVLLSLVRRNGDLKLLALTGIVFGLAILTRGYLIFVLPLVAIYLFVFPLKRARFAAIAIFVLTAALIPTAWTLRNWIVMGKPVLSTQTDQLYAGNNLWARGSQNGDVFTLGVEAPQLKVLVEKYPNFSQMSELERSEMFTTEAKAAIQEHPRHFAWLLWRKTLVYVLPFQHWVHPGGFKFHYLYLIVFIFSLPICYRGLLDKNRRDVILLFLIPIFAVYIATLITFAFDRYRFVIEPFYIILGAAGIIEFLKTAFNFVNKRAAAN